MSLNANEFFYVVKGVSAPGTAEQVATHQIPDGLTVTVTARRTNTQRMYLGDTKARAEASSTRKSLEPGQSTELRIDSTSRIWIDSDNSSDRCEITVQQIPSVS